jgi:hypothetical protein
MNIRAARSRQIPHVSWDHARARGEPPQSCGGIHGRTQDVPLDLPAETHGLECCLNSLTVETHQADHDSASDSRACHPAGLVRSCERARATPSGRSLGPAKTVVASGVVRRRGERQPDDDECVIGLHPQIRWYVPLNSFALKVPTSISVELQAAFVGGGGGSGANLPSESRQLRARFGREQRRDRANLGGWRRD